MFEVGLGVGLLEIPRIPELASELDSELIGVTDLFPTTSGGENWNRNWVEELDSRRIGIGVGVEIGVGIGIGIGIGLGIGIGVGVGTDPVPETEAPEFQDGPRDGPRPRASGPVPGVEPVPGVAVG